MSVTAENGPLVRFRSLLALQEPPLLEACLEIDRGEYPGLDAAACRRRLDELVQGAAEQDPGFTAGTEARLRALSTYLFRTEGFTGAAPAAGATAAYISDAVRLRHGLPITLSVLYLHVGRGLGLELTGVGMPSHFLVRAKDQRIYVDPFNGGALLDAEACGELLEKVTRGELTMQPEYLSPWTDRRVLERILRNLKVIYLQSRDPRRARRVINYLLEIRPEMAREYRDRGLLAYQSMLFAEAVEDLERFLELQPRGKEASAVRDQLRTLRRLVPGTS